MPQCWFQNYGSTSKDESITIDVINTSLLCLIKKIQIQNHSFKIDVFDENILFSLIFAIGGIIARPKLKTTLTIIHFMDSLQKKCLLIINFFKWKQIEMIALTNLFKKCGSTATLIINPFIVLKLMAHSMFLFISALKT